MHTTQSEKKFSPALDKTKHTQYCENKRKENDYTMNVYRRQQRCRDFGVEPVFANCLPVQCCAASGTEHAPIVAFGQRDDVHFFIILHISKTVSQQKKKLKLNKKKKTFFLSILALNICRLRVVYFIQRRNFR